MNLTAAGGALAGGSTLTGTVVVGALAGSGETGVNGWPPTVVGGAVIVGAGLPWPTGTGLPTASKVTYSSPLPGSMPPVAACSQAQLLALVLVRSYSAFGGAKDLPPSVEMVNQRWPSELWSAGRLSSTTRSP